MDLFSDLSFSFPLMRGLDVRAVQLSLSRARLLSGPADGVFGPGTALAVRAFQRAHGLKEDGIVGRNTWSLLFPDKASGELLASTTKVPAPSIVSSSWRVVLEPYKARLAPLHGAPVGDGSARWQLVKDGVMVDGKLPRTAGEPKTAAKTWADYRSSFEKCAAAYGVPVELLVATACTESGGHADRVRLEPGYVSDAATPHRVSPGLMQTLIETARRATGEKSLDRAALLDPETSIRAGACYIKQKAVSRDLPSNFDPVLVAISYNAGSLIPVGAGHWGLRQAMRDKHQGIFHVDAYLEFFNDFFAVMSADPAQAPGANTPSFWQLLQTP
ncbi:peptidoglycan-binding protein [Pseudomonas sp. UFMG81]|uniref:peptidoglycan-binding protein n=1 Tax=Pseudomonas sp. UFMG81 TaxID=2745936 RepID=UPI00188F8587|nr:peptidoglycan-binding protein [Pseudomonas sp. UFMG81]